MPSRNRRRFRTRRVCSACRFPSGRSEEHTSELQSQSNLVCRLLLEKKKTELSTSCVLPSTRAALPAPTAKQPSASLLRRVPHAHPETTSLPLACTPHTDPSTSLST